MIRTINNSDFYVYHWISSHYTGEHGFFYTLFNWSNVFPRYNTAHNLVSEFESCTRLIGFDFQKYVPILSTSTTLAYELSFGFNCLGNGFTVGNLRFSDISFDLKLSKEPIDNNFEVKLSHTGNNGLTCFFISEDFKGWILFSQALQSHA